MTICDNYDTTNLSTQQIEINNFAFHINKIMTRNKINTPMKCNVNKIERKREEEKKDDVHNLGSEEGKRMNLNDKNDLSNEKHNSSNCISMKVLRTEIAYTINCY